MVYGSALTLVTFILVVMVNFSIHKATFSLLYSIQYFPNFSVQIYRLGLVYIWSLRR